MIIWYRRCYGSMRSCFVIRYRLVIAVCALRSRCRDCLLLYTGQQRVGRMCVAYLRWAASACVPLMYGKGEGKSPQLCMLPCQGQRRLLCSNCGLLALIAGAETNGSVPGGRGAHHSRVTPIQHGDGDAHHERLRPISGLLP